MNYFWGPRLYRVHKRENAPGRLYKAGILESVGDFIIRAYSALYGIAYYATPGVAFYIYWKGKGQSILHQLDLIHSNEPSTPQKNKLFNMSMSGPAPYIATAVSIYAFALSIRALGRYLDPVYTKFLREYRDFFALSTLVARRELDKYDFEFVSYPIDFDCYGHTITQGPTPPHENDPGCIMHIFMTFISYFAIHTFGRRLVFPGATSLVRSLITPALTFGRGKLTEDYNGKRICIRAGDGNLIDAMFIDRRSVSSIAHGDILIICCEGNSGFYEIGTMQTPLDAGYSVIGWNHPGFGSSTGIPMPDSEMTAVDSIIQYSIQKMGFTPDNIGVFAWSIGGFCATWLAKAYPDLKQVTIDATFDHLEPIAISRMPSMLTSMVSFAIHRHLRLNNAEQLKCYKGPILLIRRRKDEMISTKGNNVAFNRTNNLLTAILMERFPLLFTDDTTKAYQIWVTYSRPNQIQYEKQFNITDNSMSQYFKITGYPSELGKSLSEENKARCLIYIASKYMIEYDSTHCTPLPAEHFSFPWQPERNRFSIRSVTSNTKSRIEDVFGVKPKNPDTVSTTSTHRT